MAAVTRSWESTPKGWKEVVRCSNCGLVGKYDSVAKAKEVADNHHSCLNLAKD